jgi:hypothetical protein
MDKAPPTPRSVLSYEVARRLIYSSDSESAELPPVQAAKEKLEKLANSKQIPEREYQRLPSLLRSLEGCDMDRCERTDDLVQEVTRLLSVWPEEFPEKELKRLREPL